MKRILSFIIAFSSLAAFSQSGKIPEPNTAYYWFVNSQNKVGEEVTVNLKSAVPTSEASLANQYICFECETVSDSGNFGGKIKVLVPPWKINEFLKNYCPASGSDKPIPLNAQLTLFSWRSGQMEYLLVVNQ